MQSKFKFSLDGVDATARQLAEVRRQLAELQANDSVTASRASRHVSLSVTALRLAQEAMDEVDELKATVGQLSSKIDKIEETYAKKSIDEE